MIQKIQRIHMIGELTKGDCSMIGAWGSAVTDPVRVLQLRALDWNTDGKFEFTIFIYYLAYRPIITKVQPNII